MQILRRSFTTLSAIAVVVGFGAIACGPATPPTATESPAEPASSPAAIELVVSAALSVQEAMKEVQTAYQELAPEVAITYNFGPAGSLAQQIEQGAPTDIFLSASKKWMDDLEEKGEILPDSRQDLLLNSLVAIVPADKDLSVASFNDFATDKVSKIALGEPDSVPAGQYAQETLTSLNLFDAVQSKLVFGKDVRQVLSYVETGNVDVGLVYATDAKTSERVRIIATADAETHSPIVYPIGIVADSDRAEAARAFLEFLSSDAAADIFENYGFTMANP